MERAADNIRKFHEKQIKDDLIVFEESGKILGQKYTLLKRSVFMCRRDGGLSIHGAHDSHPCENCRLYDYFDRFSARQRRKNLADHLSRGKNLGVDRIYKVGGAQAIAALAYGTESIERVYKIVGPGNRYVAEAKRQVSSVAGIDMIAGPS